MTVIAATAAVPAVSPSSGAGSQGAGQGFEALLAVATGSEERAPAKSAPTEGANKTSSKAADKASRAERANQSDAASAKADDASAADATAADKAQSDDDASAAQADAATLAASTLVAAMIPQTEETFVAGVVPEVDAAAQTGVPAAAVPLLDAPSVETGIAPTKTTLDAAAAALDAASLVAPALGGDVKLAEAEVTPPIVPPVVDVKVAAPSSAPVTAATIEIPEAALLETPVAAADVGVDVAALSAETVAQPAVAAQSAPKTLAVASAAVITPPVADPVEAQGAPVAAQPASAPAVEAAPVAAEVVQVQTQVTAQAVAQASAEPVAKVATTTVEAEPVVSTEAETVEVSGAPTASLADQAGADQGGASQQGRGEASAEALIAAATDGAAEPEAPTISQTASAPAAANAEAAPPLRAEVRGSPQTVAQLSAEILKKLDARTTRFDVALTPDGLGKVDVRIEIGRHGALTASMAFDTAQAAAELRGKSAELRQALAQAGFTVADNALRFDVSSQGGQNGQNPFLNFNDGQDGRRAWSGKAFQSAQNDDAPILSASDLLPGLRMAPDSGLDIRI